jgi:hypothetical protein
MNSKDIKNISRLLFESTSINELEKWRNTVLGKIRKEKEISDKIDNASDHELKSSLRDKYNQMFKDTKKTILSISPIAYSKIYRFHELEYKLHLLNTQYSDKNILDFTKYEINELYKWIKIFMITIMETRIFLEYSQDQWDDSVQLTMNNHNININTNVDTYKQSPWTSIEIGYSFLKSANTISDKIKAVTFGLNVWHDAGGIFGSEYEGDKGAIYFYSPFTIEQFNNIGNINSRKVEKEIKSEIV